MLKIGEIQELEVARDLPQGLYLIDPEDEEEVLLPRTYVTDGMAVGDKLNVFVYFDSEEREVATIEEPLITSGKYALLQVSSLTEVGAFCNIGVSKELLIPFTNQHEALKLHQSYVVHMYVDDLSERLVGTTKLSRHLDHIADKNMKPGQSVEILVYKETPIGYKAVINQVFSGLIYKTETESALKIGDQMTAYLKPIRPDGKIDLSLKPIGAKHVDATGKKILATLKKSKGFLPLNDKSSPEEIRETFGISKKVFKKAIGGLYKQRKILISDSGIKIKKV